MINAEKYDILDESEFNSEIREGKFVDFSIYEKEFIKNNFKEKYNGYYTVVNSESILVSNSPFKNSKYIKEIIYLSVGKTTNRTMLIGQLFDEWYLVYIHKYTQSGNNESQKFYKCDQLDSVIDLLNVETKKNKIFNKEEFDKKVLYKNKLNKVFSIIKSMNSKEFDKLYNKLVK